MQVASALKWEVRQQLSPFALKRPNVQLSLFFASHLKRDHVTRMVTLSRATRGGKWGGNTTTPPSCNVEQTVAVTNVGCGLTLSHLTCQALLEHLFVHMTLQWWAPCHSASMSQASQAPASKQSYLDQMQPSLVPGPVMQGCLTLRQLAKTFFGLKPWSLTACRFDSTYQIIPLLMKLAWLAQLKRRHRQDETKHEHSV